MIFDKSWPQNVNLITTENKNNLNKVALFDNFCCRLFMIVFESKTTPNHKDQNHELQFFLRDQTSFCYELSEFEQFIPRGF